MRTYHFYAKMVRREGIEPPSVPCKGTALPLDERRKFNLLLGDWPVVKLTAFS
jgi:hypothetical protein